MYSPVFDSVTLVGPGLLITIARAGPLEDVTVDPATGAPVADVSDKTLYGEGFGVDATGAFYDDGEPLAEEGARLRLNAGSQLIWLEQ